MILVASPLTSAFPRREDATAPRTAKTAAMSWNAVRLLGKMGLFITL